MKADRVLGVNVGGTFTDLVLWDGKQITIGKVSTTSDQSEGVVPQTRLRPTRSNPQGRACRRIA